jgi:hypothetical protein
MKECLTNFSLRRVVAEAERHKDERTLFLILLFTLPNNQSIRLNLVCGFCPLCIGLELEIGIYIRFHFPRDIYVCIGTMFMQDFS